MRILTQRETRGKKNRMRHQRNAERSPMIVSRGDTVRIMRGDDKGKEGKITKVDLKSGRVTIAGINMVKKHRRAKKADEQSGIIEMEAPMAVSNVMLLDPNSGKPTRVRTRIDIDPTTKKRTKERVSAKSGEPIAFSR